MSTALRIRTALFIAPLVLSACGGGAADPTTVELGTSTDQVVATSPTTTTVAPTTTVKTKRASTTTTTAAPVCATPATKGPVTVLAASSMVNAFTYFKARFLRDHPCVTDLVVSYGSSAVLATQIVAGAPADVFVAASQSAMNSVTNAGLNVGPAAIFARNKGEVMLYKGSGTFLTIATVEDLFRQGIRTGLCVVSAPCGSMADSILANARSVYANSGLVRANIRSETASVEDLVTKIKIGELDAGIVYHSDCVQAQIVRSNIECRDIPDNVNSSNTYLVAAVSNRAPAREFADYVASESFMSMLQSVHGFLAP